MTRLRLCTVGILMLGAATLGVAQEQPLPASAAAPSKKAPTPEEMKKSMDAVFGSMIPTMVNMTEATLEAQLNTAAKPETAARIAAFKRNLYLELQKQGFKPAEAMQIVLSTSLPFASTAGK